MSTQHSKKPASPLPQHLLDRQWRTRTGTTPRAPNFSCYHLQFTVHTRNYDTWADAVAAADAYQRLIDLDELLPQPRQLSIFHLHEKGDQPNA